MALDARKLSRKFELHQRIGGFFQVLNHGICKDVMDEMIDGVCKFNDQPKEARMEFYSRDNMRKVKFNSDCFVSWLLILQNPNNFHQFQELYNYLGEKAGKNLNIKMSLDENVSTNWHINLIIKCIHRPNRENNIVGFNILGLNSFLG